MLNYRLHENGWTVIIDDFDLRESTQDDINLIARLIATYTCVVVKNQKLSIPDELRIIRMFKNPEPLYETTDPFFAEFAADAELDPEGVLCRVTGELRDGKPGLAGWEDELVWHCNHTHRWDRRPIVWLYGVRDTAGSRTSWNNTIPAYQELDQSIKDRIQDLKSIYGSIDAPEAADHTEKHIELNWTPPLVHVNIANKIGMYFSPLQVEEFVGLPREESDEIKQILAEHVLQEKYIYHHDWQDGDLVLSEQWLGIHKRWPFKHMSKRLLHRAAFDFPDQDYNERLL